ncbi:hypothetical protein [Paenisporosarcina sp. TG-14]|uniref:hypothetical protein n=1 Tax=Paenisporosarcina sp. TG-14 TaxID=1231057 RepID=UPI0002E161B5|nr:hypothetical protein [Paenisporosarcina sp. TG-14]
MKPKLRAKGDTYRPLTKVLKEKNGLPTKVELNGYEYALIHPSFINGHKDTKGE